ncbi:hypothetical protein ONS95_002711 [Cadophora gregata]|uniref:uncharacterized protein n=1 Tax=Cadophora gregata TaxID=51156 RepID=UPI0026DDA802|nr:uncharacterized protein ONS95_002711 [Cadophora gregata]KAK0110051.1 hypothetical protein ONS95_002711 [Cadophora gregata]
MCRQIQIYHRSCQTEGQHKQFLCGDPVPETVGGRRIRTQTCDNYPMPDFCPSCLLAGGLFEDTIGVLQREQLLDSAMYKRNATSLSLAFSERVWKRAENDPYNKGDPDYFVAHLPPFGTSRAAQAYLVWVLGRLKVSFWHQVIQKRESPSQFRRKFLIQLQNYQIANYLQQAEEIYDLRETSKRCRPHILRSRVQQLSITTLPAEDSNCNICLQHLGVSDGDSVAECLVKTRCNHLFGDQCIYSWIQDNETCPMCRHRLLSFSEGEEMYIREARAQRELTGVPNWLVRLTGFNIEGIRQICEESINFDSFHLTVHGDIPPEYHEVDENAFAYNHFGFLQ